MWQLFFACLSSIKNLNYSVLFVHFQCGPFFMWTILTIQLEKHTALDFHLKCRKGFLPPFIWIQREYLKRPLSPQEIGREEKEGGHNFFDQRFWVIAQSEKGGNSSSLQRKKIWISGSKFLNMGSFDFIHIFGEVHWQHICPLKFESLAVHFLIWHQPVNCAYGEPWVICYAI